MKKKPIRIVLLVLLAAFIIIQFIPVDRSNPSSNPQEDFLNTASIDAQAASMLKKACFDCHSNYTRYPWYSFVAPASFIVANHVKEGREELNFSEWATYSEKKKAHKLEECIEALREGWMPLSGYVALHDEADLSAAQRESLATALEKIMKSTAAKSSTGQSHEGEHSEENEHDHQHDDD